MMMISWTSQLPKIGPIPREGKMAPFSHQVSVTQSFNFPVCQVYFLLFAVQSDIKKFNFLAPFHLRT